jgi:IS30 family transposase
MGLGRTGRLTVDQRRELWARWKAGETMVEIGRVLGRSTTNVFVTLRVSGGIAPAARRRRAGALRGEEREEISRGLAAGLSLRALGRRLGRAASTISREVAHNGGRADYRAVCAGERALRCAARPKACVLSRHDDLRHVVAGRLAAKWSPQQIAGWLKHTYAGDASMQISHETIYKSLFVQARGVLKQALLGALRSRRVMRRAHGARRRAAIRSLIPDAVPIRERPAEAQDRAVPGHWEGDLLMGGTSSAIATLVERRSRYLMLVRVGAKTSEDVVAALARQVRTLTWDRGSELTAHARFTMATDVKVYFCDPHSPWQRGSNENTNGLLRQYFPKGMDLSHLSQDDLDAVARELNARPRKTLDYLTPADILAQTVALTG